MDPPGAVDILNSGKYLSIHNAAAFAPVQVFQMTAEENMANLTAVAGDSRGCSVAHLAVRNKNLENVRYIHSIGPAGAAAVAGSERRTGDRAPGGVFVSTTGRSAMTSPIPCPFVWRPCGSCCCTTVELSALLVSQRWLAMRREMSILIPSDICHFTRV